MNINIGGIENLSDATASPPPTTRSSSPRFRADLHAACLAVEASLKTFLLERFPLDLNWEDYRGSLGRANQIRFLGPQRRGCAMAKGYSKDLRERVVAIVEEGDSAREAARLLNVGASTAICWIERWTTTGSVEAKPGTGHSRSPLNKHEQWLLDLIAEEPDLTLDDIRLRLSGAKKLKVGTSSIWRFYDRQEITFKKNSARRRAGSS